ncbi:MAG: hypothetical protein ACM336_18150 [Acidobacteriota bacterium]
MLATGTVLVSIPHLPLLRQIREFLRRAGYAVLVAGSASDAVQLIGSSWCNIDLLLAETPLPDAAQLVRDAVARRPAVRVLLISGEPEFVGREFVPEPGVGFIEKPFAWSELSGMIAGLLGAVPAPPNPPSAGLSASFVS